MSFLTLSCVALAFGILGGALGGLGGALWERSRWNTLKSVAMAGQTIWVKGIGDVLILGYSNDESKIDYIPTERLEDRHVDEIDPDELNSKTISVPTKQFLVHMAPDSVIQSARL